MGFDTRGWKEFNNRLKKDQKQWDKFVDDCAKELAARLLAKVIKRTPVGKYPPKSGKVGGTLRRGWTAQAGGSGAEGLKTRGVKQYVDTLMVHHFGGIYVIEIINPIEYASYVEFGHRQEPGRFVPAIGKRLVKGWVEGKFFLTISEKDIQAKAPQILENRIKRKLGEYFQ